MTVVQRGKNKTDIQKMNRSLVIKTIQRHRRITRVEIAKITGLNQATVTNIVSDLIGGGIVKEVGLVAGKGGRRSIMIELAVNDFAIIGVWLTRRHFSVGIYDIYGECQEYERFSIGLYSPVEEMLCQMVEQIQKKVALCKKQSVLGIALALPGPYIKREGHIALLTARPEWQNVNIADKLSARTGLQVITEHDAKAAVTAEWFFRQRYDETSSMVCIMPGQGVGAGVIENGRLMTGDLGIAGEIGHMSICYDGPKCRCGNRGCLEGYCSTLAIQKKVRDCVKKFPKTVCTEEDTIADIIQAYLKEDELARMVVDEAARFLGYGLANIVNLLNPSEIIIGDELSKAGQNFLKIVQESIKERVLPKVYCTMEIKLSNIPDSVLKGVCLLLVEEMVKNPEVFMQQADKERKEQNVFVAATNKLS